MRNNGLAMCWSSNLCLIHAPTQLLVFFQPCFKKKKALSFSAISLSLLIRVTSSVDYWDTNEEVSLQSFLSLLILHFCPLYYLKTFALPLLSLLFRLPSNALCSVPFLLLPQVLLTLLAHKGPITDTVLENLWLIFIYPPLRFITSAAYSSRCFFPLLFTLCNC